VIFAKTFGGSFPLDKVGTPASEAHGIFNFGIFMKQRIREWSGRNCKLIMCTGELDLTIDTVDPVGIFVMPVETEFVANVQYD
jgi:hypothetical protein